MIVTANSKFIRISPKKVKGIAHEIIGLAPLQAIEKMIFSGSRAGRLLSKVIKSAVSNAKNNAKLNEANLRIQTIEVVKGPHLKRWQPVSRGMAHQIKKRTAHIKVILEEVQSVKLKVKS